MNPVSNLILWFVVSNFDFIDDRKKVDRKRRRTCGICFKSVSPSIKMKWCGSSQVFSFVLYIHTDAPSGTVRSSSSLCYNAFGPYTCPKQKATFRFACYFFTPFITSWIESQSWCCIFAGEIIDGCSLAT